MSKINNNPPNLAIQDIERFWSYVNKTDTCWEWNGWCKQNGYGVITLRRNEHNRKVLVHRLSFYMATGIWSKLQICHKCDNRKCVRPDHLFEGTQKDNLQDMSAKGRSLKGDRNPSRRYPEKLKRGNDNPAKLNPELISAGLRKLYAKHPEKHAHGESHGAAVLNAEKIKEIRKLFEEGYNRRLIAEKFKIHKRQVYKIANREIWAHVE